MDKRTRRERNLRVFQGQPIEGVFHQPRFEPWFDLHRREGTLPEPLRGLTVFEAYDALGVSMRYISYATGVPSPVEGRHSDRVNFRAEEVPGGFLHIYDTPHGELVRQYSVAGDSCRITGFPVRTRDDLRKLAWLFANTTYVFNAEGFEKGGEAMGDRGEPQFFLPRSPYQALSLDWMRYEDFVVALMEDAPAFDSVMRAIDDSCDALYDGIVSHGGVRIINFGENIDARLMSPAFFERYHMPFYEKRATPLRRAGILTTVHIDGSFRSLLPFLRHLPMDGLEALTPVPQGDVTLEEMHEAMGPGQVLMDGIPAVYFLPEFPMETLQECVERLVSLFTPRLVLGISDELPMGAGDDALARLNWITSYCRAWRAPAGTA